jgi:hypothetical protein
MLDELEFGSILHAYQTGTGAVKLSRKINNRPFVKSDEAVLFGEVAERYSKMTGVSDLDPREILRHCLSLLGPACAKCGKARRTPRARRCLECGHQGK